MVVYKKRRQLLPTFCLTRLMSAFFDREVRRGPKKTMCLVDDLVGHLLIVLYDVISCVDLYDAILCI